MPDSMHSFLISDIKGKLDVVAVMAILVEKVIITNLEGHENA
jgi:hypothetical protein